MSETDPTETKEKSNFYNDVTIAWHKDKKYFISGAVGLGILIISFILVAVCRGTTPWLTIFAYPLLIYFIFQQVLSGFGFITGYIPIAIDIINWLSKTSKKKKYDEDDLDDLEYGLHELNYNKKKDYKKLRKRFSVLENKEKVITEKIISGRWSERKVERVGLKVEKEREECNARKKELDEFYSTKKEEITKEQNGYRGKISDLIVSRQEELDPNKFKLIMLVPIYVMLVLGIILTIIGLINPIISWANGTESGVLRVIDGINEVYKGIMAVVGLIVFYIIPSVRAIRDPNSFYVQRMKVIEEVEEEPKKRRRRRLLRKREKPKGEDFRTRLNRQFEDLRKYYWDIKQIIGSALLIPIGMSMLIVAPTGAMSVTLGVQTTIRQQELKKYERYILICVAITLILMIAPTYFSFFARFLKNDIHEIIPIILRLIYGTFLVISFILFTKQPIAQIRKDDRLEESEIIKGELDS